MRVTERSRRALAALVALTLALAVPAWSAGGSLGTARGVGPAEVSFDGGARWISLAGRALPVLADARIRTTGGGVLVDLAGGSRVNVLPYSTAQVREVSGGTELVLAYGRLAFRLEDGARAAVSTAAARFEPVRGAEIVGEVFAGDTTGLKITRGTMQVKPAGAGEPVMLASLEPVFLPRRPAGPGPLFASDLTGAAAPAGSRGVFNPKGESLGYLRPDGQLVVYPGYTNDLTRAFPPKTVQLALAGVPMKDRAVAEPLFDVNGTYVGYVAGPSFVAQAAPAAAGAAPGQSGVAPAAGVPVLTALGIGGTAAAGVAVGGALRRHGAPCPPGSPAQPATPVGPGNPPGLSRC